MKGFIFDTNKCVGCHACVVACGIENDISTTSLSWRNIHNSNTAQLPWLDQYYLSLACNHCEEPECKNACPAAAYSIDKITGSVVLDPDRCIGCRYCTWACPYDAPKFDPVSKTIQKCTFCVSRLRESRNPACVINCPTSALNYGTYDSSLNTLSTTGFPETGLKPKIRFIPSRRKETLRIEPPPEIPSDDEVTGVFEQIPDSKVNFKGEWSLWAFTLMIPILVAILAGTLSGFLAIHPVLYSILIVLSLTFSVIHLGRKMKAFMAFRNFSESWLSREIVFLSVFLLGSFVYITFFQEPFLGIFTLVSGILCLISIDRVYKYFLKDIWIHSASVFLTGLLWIGIIIQEPLPVFFILTIKIGLYAWRKILILNNKSTGSGWMSSIRILFLLVIPSLMYFILNVSVIYLFFPLLIGELLDRYEFYSEHYIQSPHRQIYLDKFRAELV